MSLPSTAPVDLLVDFRSKCFELAERYCPKLFEIPMEIGLRPQWTASSVKDRKNSWILGNPKYRSPFHRGIFSPYHYGKKCVCYLERGVIHRLRVGSGLFNPRMGLGAYSASVLLLLFSSFGLPRKGKGGSRLQ